MRIAFFGDRDFSVTVLRALIDQPGIDITRIVTRQDVQTPVVKWCREHLQPGLRRPCDLSSRPFVRDIVQSADLLLCVSFGRPIPAVLYSGLRHGGVNLHPSLLPKWRGPDPVRWAILNGDKRSGCTAHRLAERTNAQYIYWQTAVPILDADDCGTLLDRIGHATVTALPNVLLSIGSQTREPRPVQGRPSYAPKIPRNARFIDANFTRSRADRLIRALNPFRQAFFRTPAADAFPIYGVAEGHGDRSIRLLDGSLEVLTQPGR